MGETTAISWTNATHNFWIGCDKVSAGCKFCYAERQMKQYGRDFHTVTRVKAFTKPLSWKEPRMIFVNSWSDFFHEDGDPWRDEAWDVIRRTPQHTYQILTKRSERIADHLPADWSRGWENVWLGTSVENQEASNKRIPQLLAVPAKVRFLSAEPLLGPIDLGQAYPCGYYCDERVGHVDHGFWTPGISVNIHWVIVGGESGSQHRPMNMTWAVSLKNQCVDHGVAYFFKQQVGNRSGHNPWLVESDGSRWQWHQYPGQLTPPTRIEA